MDWKVESGSAGVMIQSDPELEAWLADLLAAVYLSELSGKRGN